MSFGMYVNLNAPFDMKAKGTLISLGRLGTVETKAVPHVVVQAVNDPFVLHIETEAFITPKATEGTLQSVWLSVMDGPGLRDVPESSPLGLDLLAQEVMHMGINE
ncbi:MAG: hypothetical protein OHK93_003192 [Ramalina farinacea]|uniref:Uncharacterized protein n=1 Tax=Ramalina farinacea TaxID=258253 RepID=A0AA43QVD8_9LECA|nr:hypothetical protein [Ramalina farinacea]